MKAKKVMATMPFNMLKLHNIDFNPFPAKVPLLYPVKYQKTFGFLTLSEGGTLTGNGLKKIYFAIHQKKNCFEKKSFPFKKIIPGDIFLVKI